MHFLSLLSLSIQVLAFNATADTDRNQAAMGFVPFTIQPTHFVKDAVIVTTLTTLSTVVPLYFGFWMGNVVAMTLGTAGFNYAVRNDWSTAETAHQKLWGNIENTVNNAINAKSAAAMKDQLATLSRNMQDQSSAYMAELGMTNTADIIRQGTATVIRSEQVDLSMKSIDSVLSGSNFAAIQPVNFTSPDAFLLLDAVNIGRKRCLHTEGNTVEDGTVLVVDENCNMDSLSDKLFALDVSGNLILRTAKGEKCVTYLTKFLTKTIKNKMAIYDVGAKQCQGGKTVSLRQTSTGVYSLFEGSNVICLNKRMSKSNLNTLVSPVKGNSCFNENVLGFRTMLPIPLTQGSLTPARSFEEIGVQIFYFPVFASLHLTALKEMYLHGNNKGFAKTQFQTKLIEYQNFLAINVPLFSQFAAYTGINAASEIKQANDFIGTLQTATLVQTTPASIQFIK